MIILANGKCKDVLSLNANDINVVEISQRLGRICRFDGRIDRFYSVAEHAVNLSWYFNDDSALAFEALHHDSHEAYIGDIITPLKHLMGLAYDVMDAHTAAVTREHFNLPTILAPIIEDADKALATSEALMMRPPFDWEELGWHAPLSGIKIQTTEGDPKVATQSFMLRHLDLTRRIGEVS